jgi:hypothetical protein
MNTPNSKLPCWPGTMFDKPDDMSESVRLHTSLNVLVTECARQARQIEEMQKECNRLVMENRRPKAMMNPNG